MAPGGVTFFLDENMPRRLVEALREQLGEQLGENATHLYDHFGRAGVLDPEVLRFVGERGWALVTRDRKIMRRPHERAVIQEMGIAAFFLKDSPTATSADPSFQGAQRGALQRANPVLIRRSDPPGPSGVSTLERDESRGWTDCGE